jgi:hypothetical protein
MNDEMISNSEIEFEERLNTLFNDSRACAVFLYTELTIHHLAANNNKTFERINGHSAFWNGILGALQSSAFVALGRIYDNDRHSNSALQLLRFAEKNIGIFRRSYIERRKIRFGSAKDVAKVYASEAYELPRGGLTSLRTEFDANRQFYVNRIQPIRHNVIAHAGRLTKKDRDELFENLFIRELESVAVFPLRLYEALYQLYFDGREPRLDDVPTNIAEVLKAGASPHVSTWEHRHVAATVENFLNWLTGV